MSTNVHTSTHSDPNRVLTSRNIADFNTKFQGTVYRRQIFSRRHSHRSRGGIVKCDPCGVLDVSANPPVAVKALERRVNDQVITLKTIKVR
jgi:hypothetical protein